MKALHRLLLNALLQPLEQAEKAWRQWRREADLDRLDHVSLSLLPTLTPRLEKWLDGDPHRAILLGLCRRGWSQTQLRRKTLTEAIALLAEVGIPASPGGPAVWADRYWPPGVVRNLDSLNVDLAPVHIKPAVAALARGGWTVAGRIPKSWFWLRFAPPVALRNSAGIQLRLHWRALPNTDVVWPELASLTPMRVGPEDDLLRVLGGEYNDAIYWLCDATMLLRTATDLDWNEITRQSRWRCLVKRRLQELEPALASRLALAVEERLLSLPLRAIRRIRTSGPQA